MNSYDQYVCNFTENKKKSKEFLKPLHNARINLQKLY